MLDRVREALFSTLGNLVEEARVLDLFAGSGSLGLEAASRGATVARLVESHPAAYAVLRRNVELLGLGDRAEVMRGNALAPASWRFKDESSAQSDAAKGADIVFFDPPYPMLGDPMKRKALLIAVDALVGDVLRENGVLIFHAPTHALEMLRFQRAHKNDLRSYGTSALCYLTKRAPQSKAKNA